MDAGASGMQGMLYFSLMPDYGTATYRDRAGIIDYII